MNNVTSLVPVHPGEILLEEFMVPMGISVEELASDIRVSPEVVADIIAGRKAVTAEISMRLGRYFRTTRQLWLKMQANYDMHAARFKYADAIARIEPMEGRRVPPSADVLLFRSEVVQSEEDS